MAPDSIEGIQQSGGRRMTELDGPQASTSGMFTVHPDADARIRSARLLVRTLLGMRDQIYEKHLREMLSICIWKLTEAECHHKHRTRYRTPEAMRAKPKDLQHDHVFERGKLVQALLDHPDQADTIVDKAVGCTVTRAQHQVLTALSRKQPELEGWQRYELAGITVLDTATGHPRVMKDSIA